MLNVLEEFESAVLSGLDPEGYPASTRVRPVVAPGGETATVELPEDLGIREGPASLSAHSHDQQMWNLREVVVRGRLVRGNGRWEFRADQVVPGAGFGGRLEPLKFVIGSRRNARRYLRHRGLEWPEVDWEEVEALRRRSLEEAEPFIEGDPWPEFPPEVERVIRRFRTAELTTLARDRTPITWPIAPFYDPDQGRFQSLGSIGYPGKVLAMRREPRVSLLFSDPTASGLSDPPALLVQGDAQAPDEILLPGHPHVEPMFVTVFRRQPIGIAKAVSNPISKYLMDWYMMRLPFFITPRRIRWWPDGDFRRAPEELTTAEEHATRGGESP